MPEKKVCDDYRCAFFALLLFLIFCTNATLAATNPHTPCEPLDPVIVHWRDVLPELEASGAEPEFYSYHDGKLNPLVWQTRWVNGKGDYVFSDGNPSDKKLDKILIWMAKDMGSRLSTQDHQRFAKLAMPGRWLELEFERPADTAVTPLCPAPPAYIYMVLKNKDDSSIKKSLETFIHYNAAEDFVKTSDYFVKFMNVIITTQFGWIEADKLGPNLLRRVAVDFKARALFGLIPIEISERDIESEVQHFQKGPIQLHKRIQSAAQLPFGLSGPSTLTDHFFYPNFFIIENKVSLPLGAKTMLHKARFRINVELAPQAQEIRVDLPGDKVFSILPEMPPGKYTLQQRDPSWMMFSSEHEPHRFAVLVDIPQASRKVLQVQALEYEHFGKQPADSENSQTPYGTLSLEVKIAVHKGDYPFYLSLFVPPANQSTAVARQQMETILFNMRHPYSLKSATRSDH